MSVEHVAPGSGTVPVCATTRADFAAHTAHLPPPVQRWLRSTGFDGAPDTHALLPAPDGGVEAVWAGVRSGDDPWALAALPPALPPGTYRLGDAGATVDRAGGALSWELGSYQFDLYKPRRRAAATLQLAPDDATRRALVVATAIAGTRDLVNTPSEHLGPAELAQAVRLVARESGAAFDETVGDALLRANFPSIHAVGRASTRAPRLIELNWGRDGDPRVAIVGKGVCFDSGGLDIKGAEGMRLMKKDMGGAANAIGLAQVVIALGLRLRLQLLIPAVDNAIAGNAFRPGDVFKTRSGVHIEIGNTDAEGRVVLADALAYAAESNPALIVDLATLTGAARVALGPQLPALFCRDTALARTLVDRGLAIGDPLWHLPLWDGYHRGIESDIADIVNTGRGPMAGAIHAALFLQDFVPAALPWLHVDLYAWNDLPRPGRPVGGEAQALRTLLGYLESVAGGGQIHTRAA